MMCTESRQYNKTLDDSDVESDSSGEELPIWVRGEQRWVSGVAADTTCQDVVEVLLRDEEARGKHVGVTEDYHITERWRGVEQPLDSKAYILDIWNAWGTAQTEIKISLRRVKDERFLSRRKRWRSDSSNWSDRSAYKTVHPKRLHALQNEKHPSSTEQLLKLVLAQGEVIRKQLKKLRHSEHQIGFLEEKAHKARARKHGSNYLLETYLKGLSEAVHPTLEEIPCVDKNSDSGVMTEGDSEQSQHNKQSSNKENERFSPSSDELQKDIKDDEDSSSTTSEATVREQAILLEKVTKINKRLLREEENLVRLHANFRKLHKMKKDNTEELNKQLTVLRTDMTKSACEMQHNEIVMEETMEKLMKRKTCLESLHRDLINEDQEFEMLQALLYSKTHRLSKTPYFVQCNQSINTKEVLDTLV
ncbi:ras association domain-containing protein 10-like [Agrilus planipennis]|uniref:Ras association domain-containing protein 10-like n=1 Tax=Agrilus planipennis TaxID=224129 RepID=A0A1W4WX15_AGRPL|nr:ras association domain-containing protein 10-like [Agrilus planipennis]XP_018324682.1 ras association domain-containing protein 10-like [Agrilus planipennis]XP_018324683.1 ras association domain-containing protein 10-like [Agrilus planipennis]XP_018324684.1 ras association domain-containing protein 10-like [Agrilus planipennis]